MISTINYTNIKKIIHVSCLIIFEHWINNEIKDIILYLFYWWKNKPLKIILDVNKNTAFRF